MSTGDTCNATERIGSKLKICDEPMGRGHGEFHRDGEHTWPVEKSSYAGEVNTEVPGG